MKQRWFIGVQEVSEAEWYADGGLELEDELDEMARLVDAEIQRLKPNTGPDSLHDAQR